MQSGNTDHCSLYNNHTSSFLKHAYILDLTLMQCTFLFQMKVPLCHLTMREHYLHDNGGVWLMKLDWVLYVEAQWARSLIITKLLARFFFFQSLIIFV